MNTSWKYVALGGLALTVAVAACVGLTQNQTAQGEVPGGGKAAVSGARYTVIETEGHNLIVTDNKSNTLYFYTIDKGEEVGADLKLRGSLDLNEVGKAVLRPVRAKAKAAE